MDYFSVLMERLQGLIRKLSAAREKKQSPNLLHEQKPERLEALQIAKSKGRVKHGKPKKMGEAAAGPAKKHSAGKEPGKKLGKIPLSAEFALDPLHETDMSELGKKTGAVIAEKPLGGEQLQQTEKVKVIVEHAHKLRLVTDFDRVLEYVRGHGKASYSELSRELGMPLSSVDECCAVLQDEGEVEVIYPPLGTPYARLLSKDAGNDRKI